MPKAVAESNLRTIEEIVRRHPEGIALSDIVAALDAGTPQRTLQYRLRQLVDAGRIVQQGQRRWRSEEHTSELQSLMRISYAVFCSKKKNVLITHTITIELQKNNKT